MKPYTPGGNADSVVAITDCSRAAFLRDPWYQARNIEARANGFSSLSSIFALASLAQGIRLAFFNIEYSTTGIDSGNLMKHFPRLQHPEVWVRCDWFMPILLTGVCVCWHPDRIHQMLWEATARCTTATQAVQFVHRRAHNPDATDLMPCEPPNVFWVLITPTASSTVNDAIQGYTYVTEPDQPSTMVWMVSLIYHRVDSKWYIYWMHWSARGCQLQPSFFPVSDLLSHSFSAQPQLEYCTDTTMLSFCRYREAIDAYNTEYTVEKLLLAMMHMTVERNFIVLHAFPPAPRP